MKRNLIHITSKSNLSSIMETGLVRNIPTNKDHSVVFDGILKEFEFDKRVLYFLDDDKDSMEDFMEFKHQDMGITDFVVLRCLVDDDDLIPKYSIYVEYKPPIFPEIHKRRKHVMYKGNICPEDIIITGGIRHSNAFRGAQESLSSLDKRFG